MTQVTNSTPDAEAARVLIDRQMMDLRTAVPAVVVAISGDGTTVDVQPAINMAQTLDGQTRGISMPVLAGVPLAVLGSTSGGFFVCVPVRPGDDGLLIVCDRALDNWQYGSGTAMPPLGPSPRHHDLTDAVFIPGLQRASSGIPAYPTDRVSVRNRAGTVQLQVSDTGVDVIGALRVAGNVTVVGSIGSTGPVVGAGVGLSTHRHTGVTTGLGTTGTAIP